MTLEPILAELFGRDTTRAPIAAPGCAAPSLT
jgi:hypothetical protein